MTVQVDHIPGHTFHARKGGVPNAFRYSVDYVLVDAEANAAGPALFSRNSANLVSLHDGDHGGAPGRGRGPVWVRDVLRRHQLPQPDRILLLAQPRVLGHVFNPVSFWLCYREADRLVAAIAEVTNTYGDRHSYLCHKPDLSAIGPCDRLVAQKIMHVSPFQPTAGAYEFRFDVRDGHIGILISLTHEDGGLVATLTGKRVPLTGRGIVRMLVRRPFGSRRVLALIHWQALKLWWKGVGFRNRPEPPVQEVSRG